MPHIEISQDLFHEIQQVLPATGSADQFVSEAVREKLAHQLSSQSRVAEFTQLSEISRRAMEDRGITEEDILADFDQQRQ